MGQSGSLCLSKPQQINSIKENSSPICKNYETVVGD